MRARILICATGLFLLGITLPRTLLAQVVLTESKVVELARSHAPGAALGRASLVAADASERGAGLLPNPSVAWQRETLGDGGPVQDTLQLTVPLAFARPAMDRSLASADAETHRANAELEESAAVGQALAALLELVLAERQIQLLEEELASLREASRVLDARTAAGGGSGYESARLTLEVEAGRSRLVAVRAQAAAVRSRLAVLLDLPNTTFKAEASLTLRPLPPSEQLVERAVASRRHLVHARRSAAAANTARGRGGWLWVPDVSLIGGVNAVKEDTTRYGYVAGVVLGLPVFSRGQDLRARADAQHAMASARATALEREVRAEVAEAHATHEAARLELARFHSATGAHAGVLVQAARSGYREGARTVIELLDAERMYAQVAQAELSIVARGKQAELRLRMATGER